MVSGAAEKVPLCDFASGCCARHPKACAHLAPQGTSRVGMHTHAAANNGNCVSNATACGSACRLYDPVVSLYACRNGSKDVPVEVIPEFSGNAYFLGDSMSMQHYHAFACQLLADVPAPPIPAVARLEGSTCSVRRDGRAGRVCHVRGGGINVSTAAVAAALLPELLTRDVVVANEGLWHRALHSEDVQGERAQVQALIPLMHAMQRRGAVPLWRETTAQHFATPSGQYTPTGCKGAAEECGSSCRPIRKPSVHGAQTAATTAAMHAAGIGVLSVWNRSVALWMQHVEHRGTSIHRPNKLALDCTHFCEPARLFTEMTLDIIKHAGHRPSALAL